MFRGDSLLDGGLDDRHCDRRRGSPQILHGGEKGCSRRTRVHLGGDGLGRGEDHAGAHSLGSRDNDPQPQARVEEGVVALSDLIAHTVILKGLNRDAGGDQGLSPRP